MAHAKTVLLSAGAALTIATAVAIGAAHAAAPPLPSSAQVINIIDVGGQLALNQKAIEAYQKSHSNLVSRFVFTKATAPEVPAKVLAGNSSTSRMRLVSFSSGLISSKPL